MMKGRKEEAHGVLLRLSNETEARQVLTDIENSLSHTDGRLLSFGWLVVIVGIMLSLFQQFVGINAVLYYAPLMFKQHGRIHRRVAAPDDHRRRRERGVHPGRARHRRSLGQKAAADSRRGGHGDIDARARHAVRERTTSASSRSSRSCAYIGGFALSWGPVVWVLLAEIFPNAIKGKAMAIAVCAQWLANLFVSCDLQDPRSATPC